jgi:CheY-like chemotaxis protein
VLKNQMDDSLDTLQDDGAKPSKGKALIAEDIKTNRLVLSSLLQTLEIDSVFAVDGQEALDKFKADPMINFILMDVKMPVMDGVEATLLIREWEDIKKLSATPIIAVTAFDYAEDIKRCMQAGMDDVMYKPVDLKNLAKVVDKYLGIKKIDPNLLSASPAQVTTHNLLENRQEPIFSQEWLSTFVSDHKKLASIILNGAMNDIPSYFNLLRDSVELQNWPESQAVIHVLKGVMRQVGAQRLATVLQELHAHLKNGGTMDMIVFDGLLKEYHQLEEQLQAWLKKNL